MEHLLNDLFEGKNIRASLSGLRALIKDEANCLELKKALDGKMDVVISCLNSDDAKTRKNAVLLLGDLECEQAKESIYEAYLREETLFVNEAYLTSLSKLDVEAFVPDLKKRLEVLSSQEISDENRKHIEEEKRAIRKIIIKYEGIPTHTFNVYNEPVKVIVTCNRNHRELVRRQIGENAKVHPFGVAATTTIQELLKIRSFREILFPIDTKGFIEGNAKTIATALNEAGLVKLISKLHNGRDPFYYRIDCHNAMDLDKRSDFVRKIAMYLDSESDGMLVNSSGDYEVEIRLIANKEDKYFAAVKISTIKDKRFSYRKNAISASIHPSSAALIMEIAKPYLKEHGQILDPFCGVGTMLIERNYAVDAREIYGIDIFGDAINMARENTDITGMRINYIHKDFFDFKHDYKFDEIITNMPIRGKKTKDEMEELYDRFFDKASEVLTDNGIIVMYSNELGYIKKYLRINKDYKLLQETQILSKGDYYLFVLGRV